jgi:DNA-binding NarL/FixJ family response regulator
MLQEEATRILLVDSRAVSRVGLTVLLNREAGLEVIGEAADLESAVSHVGRLAPSVVIVDCPDAEPCSSAELRLLIGAGATDCPKVLAIVPRLEQAARCWQMAGAWGVLDNQATPEHIVAAIRMIAAGYRLVVPPWENEEPVAEGSAEVVRADSSEQDLESSGITRRERDVLELIIRGYSNAEISEALFLSESTVKSHVQRMLEKLALRNRVHAVIYAYEKGIVRAGGNLHSALGAAG